MSKIISVVMLLAIALVQQGCSYETRIPQYSIAIYTDGNEDILLRAAVTEYAKSHGYPEKMSTSIEDELNKQEIVVWSFHAENKSFISLTNFVVLDCYDLGVYSANSSMAAKTAVQEISQILGHATQNLRIDFSGIPCSKK